MAKISGDAIRLKLNTGTVGTPVYTVVECEVTSSLNLSFSEIDTTGKCSSGWKENLGTGTGAYTITASGHYEDNGAAIAAALSSVYTTKTHIMFQWTGTGLTTVFQGTAQVTALDFTAEHDGVVQFSITLSGSGELQRV